KKMEKIAFDSWKYKHYFQLKKIHGKNIMVICLLCKLMVREYSTAKNSTSNLKKHLDNIHKTTELVARLDTQQSLKRPRGDDDKEDDDDDITPAANKKCSYMYAQKSFERKLLNFMIETIQPLDIVEQPSFKQLVEGPNTKVMTRKTLTNHIDATYRTMRTTIMVRLADIKSVCTTADIWTAHNKSFFGMTYHWIDPTSLQWVSTALTCTRIHGKHTFDVIASLIDEIHTSFSLGDKVVRTVTDNGSNFAKAFKEYGFQEEEDEETAEVDHNFGLISDVIDHQPFQLPKHQHCTAHTLNLIAAYDIHKHLSCTSSPSALYHSSIAKCSALWNKASHSCKAYEVIEDNANRKQIVPCVTRWNSFYNAVERVMSIEHLSIVDEMGVAKFKMHEITFLKEYCKVLKPLAMALDIVQGEEKCFYGYILPTLLKLMDRLQHSKVDLKVATSVPDAIITSIRKRFALLLDTEGKLFQEAMLAAVTLPMFKLRWLLEDKHEHAKMVLNEEARKISSEAGTTLPLQQQESAVVCADNFFDYHQPALQAVDVIADKVFLCDSDISLACMSKYPNMREVFLKYNATIPSSAPVERLFSLGARVFAPRRNRLSDERVEELILLQYN
uniref:HAT C-terminal dimerisation domain-containing protein n=1 Tax=Latimeria chalumnae TaxID=7897 RepID=H3ALT8_LATCH